MNSTVGNSAPSENEDALANVNTDTNAEFTLRDVSSQSQSPISNTEKGSENQPWPDRIKYLIITLIIIAFAIYMLFGPNYIITGRPEERAQSELMIKLAGLFGGILATIGAFIAVYTEVEPRHNRHWKSVGAIFRFAATTIAFGVLYSLALLVL